MPGELRALPFAGDRLGSGCLEAHSLVYYDWVLQTMRNIAFRVLPLLVVVWMAFAVFGGALYTVKHGEPSGDSLVKTGIGLCAATAAILFSGGPGKVRPPAPDKKYLPLGIGPRSSQVVSYGASAPLVVPLAPLLQVFRT